MRKLLSIMILCIFFIGFLALFGCKEPETIKVYVCENGKEVKTKSLCAEAVSKKDAESYAKRYVGAYFTPYGGKAQLISSYLDAEAHNYIATFVVAVKEGEPYETEVTVDGITGQVTCKKNCDYI